MKLLNVAVRAGGLTPNKAKELTYKALGGVAEDYEGDWGNVPLEARKLALSAQAAMGLIDADWAALNDEKLEEQLERQIAKAGEWQDGEIATVLKEIRGLLRESSENVFTRGGIGGIIKGKEQPRDEKGRLASDIQSGGLNTSMTKAQAEKSIRSINKQISEHREKIRNPSSFIKDYASYDERRKSGIIRFWEKEIANMENQLIAARQIADKEG